MALELNSKNSLLIEGIEKRRDVNQDSDKDDNF